ncbi:MAG TPA: DUF4340 domain-containing protein [Polyangiales bacterium]|nr:DUF4340 domain-containing protein [Polyangiales bacterium]
MQRTSLILGVLAASLLAFILIFERGSVSTKEREDRKGRVLDTFVREKVTRLEIQRKGVTTVLVRKPAPEDGLDLGPWQVDAPYKAKADSDAMEGLLGSLEWIDPKRTLHDADDKDRAKFGLDKPRYRVTFTVGSTQGGFRIGGETADGSGVYMQASDPKLIYVVGKDVVEALDHEPNDLHTKVLHESNFSIYGAERLTLHDASGEHVIEKRGDLFWLAKPEPGLASNTALSDFVSTLDSLRAQRMVATGHDNLASYGLDAPRFEAKLDSQTYGALPKPGEKRHAESLRLRVGKACAGHAAESYVIADEGPVMCAANADLDKLTQAVPALRDLHLIVFDESQVRSVRMQSGARELALNEDGDHWSYKLSESGHERASGSAEQATISDWLKALANAKADSFAPAPPSQIAQAAFGNSTITITFDRGKERSAYKLVLTALSDHVNVSRADEALMLSFPLSVLDLVNVSTVRFRKTALLDEKEEAFRSFTLTRKGGVRETVTRNGEVFKLQGPAEIEPEHGTLTDIVRLVAKLQAVRFVADGALPQHGLAQPDYVLDFDFAAHHTLRIGAATEGGRFAQLDGDPQVFVAPTSLTMQLEEPLVSHAALATPFENIAEVRVEHGKDVWTIERKGDAFAMRSGSPGDASRAQDIARAIATLRAARGTSYGKPSAEEGLDRPEARVVVTLVPDKQPAQYTLSIGKPTSADTNADVYVRRSDLNVGFTLPRSAVNDLLGVHAPAISAQPQ